MKFEVGKTYECRSVCDRNCVWKYRVTKVSASMVTIESRSEGAKRKKIYTDNEGVQICYPQGQYSMCPILSADKLV
jgi:hypothetical protein